MDLPQPDGPFQWVHVGGADALVCQPLECLARHLFTTRRWGVGPGAPAGEGGGTGAGPAALFCQPLECLARHLFTTRRWGMGPGAPAGEEGWTAVARATGVAP